MLAAPWMKQITSLDIGFNYLTPEMLREIATSPSSAQLKSLNFSSDSIGAEGAKILAGPDSVLTNLEELVARECHIGGEGLAAIAAPNSALKNLKKLALGFDKVSGVGIAALAAPDAATKQLQDLRLGSCSVTDDDFEAMAASPSLSNLHTFWYNGGGEGVEAMVTSRGMQAIASPTSHLKNLRDISFWDRKLNDACMEALFAPDTALSGLKSADFYGSKITDVGVEAIASPKAGIKGLTTLGLTINRSVTAKSAKAMAKPDSSLSHLKKLGLGHVEIGDEGIGYLAAQTAPFRLHTLFADWAGITDKGVEILTRDDSALRSLTRMKLEPGYSSQRDVGKCAELIARNLPNLAYTDHHSWHNETILDIVQRLRQAQIRGEASHNLQQPYMANLTGFYDDASERTWPLSEILSPPRSHHVDRVDKFAPRGRILSTADQVREALLKHQATGAAPSATSRIGGRNIPDSRRGRGDNPRIADIPDTDLPG